jgi:hypothetical protein
MHVGSSEEGAVTVAILEDEPCRLESRFELAALRLVDAWLGSGMVRATAADVEVAREFLERLGFRLQALPGLVVRLVSPAGESADMPREAAVLVALRRLATREQRRRRSECRPSPLQRESTRRTAAARSAAGF